MWPGALLPVTLAPSCHTPPAGVGESTPVTCGFKSGNQLAEFAAYEVGLGEDDFEATVAMVAGKSYPTTKKEVSSLGWVPVTPPLALFI